LVVAIAVLLSWLHRSVILPIPDLPFLNLTALAIALPGVVGPRKTKLDPLGRSGSTALGAGLVQVLILGLTNGSGPLGHDLVQDPARFLAQGQVLNLAHGRGLGLPLVGHGTAEGVISSVVMFTSRPSSSRRRRTSTRPSR
jgi:hypothetical protein